MAKSGAAPERKSRAPILRCAIYTRKSSEEGLEQDFNSLQAQREACEAYVLSQRHEGWAVVDTAYDDGGYSGGNLERPALKKLLADIEQKKIDVVVVYKVDRLTRALTDFARIVEQFDAQSVSFVSITQQFNTTTSMGRLTLNVLLSFAQFEREVTGERIRDKIAASKQKGMWMGGAVPLGYSAQGRTLVINEPEAESVRTIFNLYLERGTVFQLQVALRQRGISSRQWTTKSGEVRGGKTLSAGHLYRILNNPLYRGLIRHHDQVYAGQHPAIIDEQTWEAVQQQLKNHTRERQTQSNATEASLLAGLIHDENGAALISHHANKRGKRYRYYIDSNCIKQAPTSSDERYQARWRIPAQTIEQLIIFAIAHLLKTPNRLMELCGALLQEAQSLDRWLHRAKQLGDAFPQQAATMLRIQMLQIIRKVDIGTSQVALDLSPQGIYWLIEGKVSASSEPTADDFHAEPIIIPWQIRRRGVEMKLVIPGDLQAEQKAIDDTLVRAIAKGHVWMEQITSGRAKTLAEIAKQNGVTGRWVSRLINLACLAPDIVERILEGTQPAHLTLQKLLVHEALPADWQAQRELLLA